MLPSTPKLTAEDVKDALRRRHRAFEPMYEGVGRWTCIEEWENIDLLALDAWASAEVVGYEVKVSRGDMRSELLDPTKRARAVAMCTRFYFAVPAGLLTPAERAYEEPEWAAEDFVRQPCTNPICRAGGVRRGWHRSTPKPRGKILRGTAKEGVSIHLGFHTDRSEPGEMPGYSHTAEVTACCAVCKGYGTTKRSRVENEAPTLWVPRDVGLVVVGPGGCSVLKESPVRKITEPIIPWPYRGRPASIARISEQDVSRLERQAINQLVRWVSFRPDPRHTNRSNAVSDVAVLARLASAPPLDEEPLVQLG